MKKISAIIIAKNEENNILACIKSLSFCDEVIVIDNESTDSTAKLSLDAGVKVYSLVENSFSKLRNFGKIKAKYEWLLYVDADERVSDLLAKNIIHSKNITDFTGYNLNRVNYYYNIKWLTKEKMVRFMNKESLDVWEGILHESPIITGREGELNGDLLHYTHDDFSKMVNKTNIWSDYEANLRIEANHPRMTEWRFFRIIFSSFIKSFINDGGWKMKTAGLVESVYQSFSMFISYAKLWEKQNVSK
jgi:glycosyltransferase involved in cell wall biosynthesis